MSDEEHMEFSRGTETFGGSHQPVSSVDNPSMNPLKVSKSFYIPPPDFPKPKNFIGSNDGKKHAGCLPKFKVLDEETPPVSINVQNYDLGINQRQKVESNPVVICLPPTADIYCEGEVKSTTIDALKDMVQKLPEINTEGTGCIINETCVPECSKYTQDIHFVISESLGHGSFGEVDLCYDLKTKKPFVRKKMLKGNLRASEVIAPIILDHPNITKVFGLVQRGHSAGCEQPMMELYLEYGGPSLAKIYQGGKRFENSQIKSFTKQGLDALNHMDHYNIIHHDIKPENISILEKDGSQQLKITDFGSSRLPTDCLEFVGVTPEYVAPEICQLYLQIQNLGLFWGLTENDITGKVDIFAFGLVVMYMFKGYHILVKVFNEGNETYVDLNANTRGKLRFNMMIQLAIDLDDFFVQKLIPDECCPDMRDLLFKMTQHKHQSRVSARQAFEQIKAIEKRLEVYAEKKFAQETQKQKIIPPYCGPATNRTLSPLRNKVKGKGSKNLAPMTPQTEKQNLRGDIASKKLQMPASPLSAFVGQSLEQTAQRISSITERNVPLTQLSMDTSQETFAQETQKQKIIPQNMSCLPDQGFVQIPAFVEDCMKSVSRPAMNHILNLLRNKLPYEKNGHKGKGSKNLALMTPQTEMQNLRGDIASKKSQMPVSSLSAFGGQSLEQTLKEKQTAQRISGITVMNVPLTQPSMDTSQESFFDLRKRNDFEHSRGIGSTLVEESHQNVSNNTNNVPLLQVVQTPGSGQQNITISPAQETEVQPNVSNLDEYVGNRTQTVNAQQMPHSQVPEEDSGTAPESLPDLGGRIDEFL